MAVFLGSQQVLLNPADSYYDTFWDAYQDKGNRNNYRYAFYRIYWNDVNFRPKYNIVPAGDGQYIFQHCGVTDMKGILAKQGVILDLSKTPSLYYCFSGSKVTRLPELNCIKCSNFQNMCNSCSSLISIDKLIMSDKATGTSCTSMFLGCSALEHVIFEGTLAANLDLSGSPLLSKESILSLLNILKSGIAGTITLGTTNLAKLSDAEKAIATGKGWSLA